MGELAYERERERERERDKTRGELKRDKVEGR